MWEEFENGNTIGTKGSQNGEIIRDEELTNPARITLEKDGSTAPFSITVGVYGLFFHTAFYGDLKEGNDKFDLMKSDINNYFIMSPEEAENWIDEFITSY